jgi:hypothetical protein
MTREGAVVNVAVDYPNGRYAVIEGLQTETGHEHIVIAYPNEKTLRAAFAAPSIVAFGFATREEAAAVGAASFLAALADQRTREPKTSAGLNEPGRRLDWTDEPGATKCSALRRLAGFLINFYGGVFASTLVMFASSNRVSAAIRMALGSSI